MRRPGEIRKRNCENSSTKRSVFFCSDKCVTAKLKQAKTHLKNVTQRKTSSWRGWKISPWFSLQTAVETLDTVESLCKGIRKLSDVKPGTNLTLIRFRCETSTKRSHYCRPSLNLLLTFVRCTTNLKFLLRSNCVRNVGGGIWVTRREIIIRRKMNGSRRWREYLGTEMVGHFSSANSTSRSYFVNK